MDYKLPPSYKLSKIEVGHGPGSFLEPPNHPRYETQSIYTAYGNSPPGDRPQYLYHGHGYRSLEAVDKNFKPLPYTHPMVKLWEDDLYAYFHNSYSPNGVDRNVNKAVIGGSHPDAHHLAYLKVKEYYPDAQPRHDLIVNPPKWGGNRSEQYGRSFGTTPKITSMEERHEEIRRRMIANKPTKTARKHKTATTLGGMR